MKRATSLVGLAVLLVGFSGVARAQDKQPDNAAIVDSFKQNILDVLKAGNSKRGPEHAAFYSRNVETPAPLAAPAVVPMQGKGLMGGYVNKDGSPCKITHTGRCYQGFTDSSGALYRDSRGVPCNPEKNPDTCSANGVTAAAELAAAKPAVTTVWWKQYTETVSQYGFDVKVADSLVTPYRGVLSYSEVIGTTAEHPTREEAEQDNNFTRSRTYSHTATYGYQDGKWVAVADTATEGAALPVSAALSGNGRVKGTLTFLFNSNYGTKPDVGAKVVLVRGFLDPIPADAFAPLDSLATTPGDYDKLAYSIVAHGVADGNGNFEFTDIPPGAYTIVMQSSHAVGKYVSVVVTTDKKGKPLKRPKTEQNLTARDISGLVFSSHLMVEAGKTEDQSHDFGISALPL